MLEARLLGIRSPQQLETHPFRGCIFETFVVAELVKSQLNQGVHRSLYFWRDSNGNEVDVIAEQGGKLMPIEIKSGKTVTQDFFRGLEKWQPLSGDMSFNTVLIYGGDESYRYRRTQVIGWQQSGILLMDSNRTEVGKKKRENPQITWMGEIKANQKSKQVSARFEKIANVCICKVCSY